MKIVVIPITCCSYEWIFSDFTIIKFKLRSILSQKQLKSLLFLSVWQEMTISVGHIVKKLNVLTQLQSKLVLK